MSELDDFQALTVRQFLEDKLGSVHRSLPC